MDSKENLINSISDFEQRVFLKFCVLLDYSTGVAEQQLKRAIGRKAYSKTQIKDWMKNIKNGRYDVSDQRGGDVSDHAIKIERIEMVKNALEESRHWTQRSLSLHLNLPKTTVQKILMEDLKMRKVLGKWVPHNLSSCQLQNRVNACKLNLNEYSKHPNLIKRTFSIDETWVSLYMQPNRNQSRVYLYPGEKPPQIISQNIHSSKRMLILAVDFDGIAFYKLLPQKTTVTGPIYREFLEENVPDWLAGKSFRHPILLHDNARPHFHRTVKEYLEKEKIALWTQPGYSPDISPCDYDANAKIKTRLRTREYTNWNEFENHLKKVIEDLNKENAVLGVRHLPDRWRTVIDQEGHYI